MFGDEARFGRITDPAACWAPSGIRPIVPCQAIREYTYAYAAVAPGEGTMDSLILPDMYASTLQVFLDELSARHPDRLILFIIDGAPSHRAGKEKLTIPWNIRIIELPPYSPECNPTEDVWDEMREKFFCNCVFQDMAAVEQRLVTALLSMEQDRERLRSITHFPWIEAGLVGIN
jgi:transposase